MLDPNAMAAGAVGLALAACLGASCHLILAPRRGRLRRLAGMAGSGVPRDRGAAGPRPGRVGERLRAWRRRRARNAQSADLFSVFLDLLIVCVESGMNLHQAVIAASGHVPGRLGTEMLRVRRELEQGRSLTDVLDALAVRLPLDEVRGFVRLAKRGQRLGTPVVDSLRQTASFIRRCRRQRLARALGLLPLKLTLCVLCFFLPPILVVLLLPAFLGLAGGG